MIANTGAFLGKTIFVTGGSRGIGKAIALKLAKDGANVVIAAKTTEKHPKLEGTIFTAAEEIEKAGGKCLPVKCDLRHEDAVKDAFDQAINQFGKIDILINNASAISLTDTESTDMKKFDLMHQINTRGTFMASKYALPHLKKSSNAHILNMSPPLDLNPNWFGPHVAYTMAKYGMSMCVLGMAQEFKSLNIAVNALWPRTAIQTAAMQMLSGGNAETIKSCRTVDILSDAAYVILSKESNKVTGNFFIDEDVVREHGVTDMDIYAVEPGHELQLDFFLPAKYGTGTIPGTKKSSESSTSASAEAQPASGDGPGLFVKMFQSVDGEMAEQVKKEVGASLIFRISGVNYMLDAHPSRPFTFEKVAEDKRGDVLLIAEEDVFTKMAQGKLKPTNAFMSGKLKIKGNIAVAMKAEKLFKALKPKL